MIERMTEPEFWIKGFLIAVWVLITFMCFGSAFDRTQDMAREARVALAVIGIIGAASATAIYRWM